MAQTPQMFVVSLFVRILSINDLCNVVEISQFSYKHY